MRIRDLLAALTIVASSQQHEVWASITLSQIINQCEGGMTAENCKLLIESNGYDANVTVIQAKKAIGGAIVHDVFYYQVDLYIDYHGYVLGPYPDFKGTVTYPYEWRGGTEKNLGTRQVGPWDCEGLTDIQCCGKVERDVFDKDVNGNYLSCWMEEAFYKDPVTGELFGVHINPVDKSINYLTEEDLQQLEERELIARNALVVSIDETLVNNNCPKVTLQRIHSTFLHTMRGITEARSFPKGTKEAIRRMNREKLLFLDVTKDSELQYWLPLMKEVVKSVTRKGGLHPVTQDAGGYVVRTDGGVTAKVTIIRTSSNSSSTETSVNADVLTRTPDELVSCISENTADFYACDDLMDGVTVITVHPRSIKDRYYNQVVVPIDFKGAVLGSQPSYDGMIYYALEWRGRDSGARHIGPWDCKGLTDAECCEFIQTSVSDPDIEGRYVDCWLQEAYYKDPYTKKMRKIFFDDEKGTIGYASDEDVYADQVQEESDRTELRAAIESVLPMTECPKTLLWKIYSDIRHEAHGLSNVQGDPQILREVLLSELGNTVNVTENMILQTVLPKISSALTKATVQLSTTLGVVPTTNTVVVTVDENNIVIDVSRIIVGGS